MIFLLDDDEEFCLQVKDLLCDHWQVKTFNEPQKFLNHFTNNKPKLVIIDYNLGKETNKNGFDIIKNIKNQKDSHLIPILLVSGVDQNKLIEHAFNQGIEDYIQKPFNPTLFVKKIEHIIFNTKHKIHLHPLTGLPGNLLIEDKYEIYRNKKQSFFISYTDVDNFKPYNDNKGVTAGDILLREMAQHLKLIRKEYSVDDLFIGNLGGDDFFFMGLKKAVLDTVKRINHFFDHNLDLFFNQDEIKNKYYASIDRNEKQKKFDLVTISSAILEIKDFNRDFSKITEISAWIKKKAKKIKGNSAIIEVVE